MATAEQEIRELEGRRFGAVVRGDFAELEHMLGDDLTYTHNNGMLENKAQYLAGLRSGRMVYHSIEPQDVLVRVYGEAAVVTGRATLNVDVAGQSASLVIRFTDVYAKQDGRWRMVAWQASRLTE